MIMIGKKKHLIAQILGPEAEEKEPDQEGGHEALTDCAHELIEAIKSGDAEGVVSSLRAMFLEMDSEPHKEGPHIEEE